MLYDIVRNDTLRLCQFLKKKVFCDSFFSQKQTKIEQINENGRIKFKKNRIKDR